MAYALAPDIALARIDDILIFLDVAGDRYFRLPSDVERALTVHLDGDRDCAQQCQLEKATTLGVLVQSDATSAPIAAARCPYRVLIARALKRRAGHPTRSARAIHM